MTDICCEHFSESESRDRKDSCKYLKARILGRGLTISNIYYLYPHDLHQPPHGQGDHEDHLTATQIYSSVAKIPRAAPAVSQPIGSSETGVWCGDQETACNMAQLDTDILDFQHKS